MRLLLLLLSVLVATAAAASYTAPPVRAFFQETFQAEPLKPTRWKPSAVPKYTGEWKVDAVAGLSGVGLSGDRGLVAVNDHRYFAVSRKLSKAVEPAAGQHFVLQFEFRPLEVWDCSGGYLKLIGDAAFDPLAFDGNTDYEIMFGPDRCGPDSRVHFIVKTTDPLTGKRREHHLVNPPEPALDYFTHHYQLVVDVETQEFEIFVDMQSVSKGSLRSDFEPPFEPPQTIDDPSDVKPADWVDDAKIPDESAVKPEDWDEEEPEFIPDPRAKMPAYWKEDVPEYIPDPQAVKPEDWSDEDDGEWIVPQIPNPECADGACGKWEGPLTRNPAYKGKWKPPLVDNPAYKGPWKARQIPNPAAFPLPNAWKVLKPIHAIGIEMWQVQSGSVFDNIVMGDNKKALDSFARATWKLKSESENVKYKARHLPNNGNRMSVIEGFSDFLERNPTFLWLAPLLAILIIIGFIILVVTCTANPAGSVEEQERAARAEEEKVQAAEAAEVAEKKGGARRRKPQRDVN